LGALVLLFCAGAGNSLTAAPNQPALVTPSLIANTTAIAPGQKFLVGVEFKMSQGWHIYAPNPGQIGKPTTINLQLPPGFTADQPAWPAAVTQVQEGFTVNLYENTVFVVIPVTAPANLTPGQPVTLKAPVDWLACSNGCVPGKQDLTLTLPVVATPGQTAA